MITNKLVIYSILSHPFIDGVVDVDNVADEA